MEVYLDKDKVFIAGQWYTPKEAAKLLNWPAGVKHVLPLEDLDNQSATSVSSFQSSNIASCSPGRTALPDAEGSHQTPNREALCVPRETVGQEDSERVPISQKFVRLQDKRAAQADPLRGATAHISGSGAVRNLFQEEDPIKQGTAASAQQLRVSTGVPPEYPKDPERLNNLVTISSPEQELHVPTDDTPADTNPIMANEGQVGQAGRWPNLRLPTFGGKPEEFVDNYFDQIDSMAKIYSWNDDQTLAMSLHGLVHEAGDWVKTLAATEKDTYEHLRDAVKKLFGDRRPSWQRHRDLFSIKQGRGQSVLQYYNLNFAS